MSVKAMGLVWDLECPKVYNGVEFRPSHKFTLLAYADHADHQGKNIWPSVKTIAKKTGFDERSVQRLTNDLEAMGFLVEDGQGPKGTNKWYLAFNDGGWQPVTPTHRQGDKNEDSLGDIPSGDIPSGDSVSPEFKEPEPDLKNLKEIPEEKFWQSVLGQLKMEMPRASFDSYVRDTRAVRFDGNALEIAATNAYGREWLESRLQSTAERLLVGIMNASVKVVFVVPEKVEA
jgi:hypothetical protein